MEYNVVVRIDNMTTTTTTTNMSFQLSKIDADLGYKLYYS